MNILRNRSFWKEFLLKSRRFGYFLIFVLIIGFLANLGAEPWLAIKERKEVFLSIVGLSAVGIFVQTAAFNASIQTGHPRASFERLLRIWSLSALISVIAPFFAGIASRTVLLLREGVPLQASITASGRQVWFGLEMAFLIGGLALLLSVWPFSKVFSTFFLVSWVAMVFFRKWLAGGANPTPNVSASVNSRLRAVAEGLSLKSYFWFISQILCMAVIYYAGFNGYGAEFSVFQSVALASATVVMSLLFFVPNGLGIADAVWIFIAKDSGLSVEYGAALAITFRMGHFLSAIILFFETEVLLFSKKKASS